MNLIDKFILAINHDLAAPACIYDGKVMSRAQLYQMVSQLALALHERGVVAGDTIGVSLGHSPAHLAVILALARLGAISLPVHPRTVGRAKRRLMEQFGCKRLIAMNAQPSQPSQPDQQERAERRRSAGPSNIEILPLADLKPADPTKVLDLRNLIEYWPTPETPGRIGLTSGTTGAPNAVCYTHDYWLARITNTIEHCDATTRLIPGNLHLTMGNISAFAALFAGGVVVFHKQHDLPSFIDAIHLYAVTHAMMAPAMIKDVAARLPFEGNAFPTLKYLRIVGGGLSEHLVKLAKRKITPNLWLPYGISEVGAIAMASPEWLDSHPDFAGQPKPGVEVQVVDAEGHLLPVGQSGEIRVRVPQMPQAYYMNPQRSAEKFRDGWFYTSDIGLLNEEGLLRIEGRSDDRINLGGVKLYPERVEHVLNSHPEVRDSAVFALPDQDNNKVLVAALVLDHDGKPEANLIDFCRERKLGNLTPRRFFIVKELPRNPAGKLLRSALPTLLRKPNATVH